MYIEKGELFTTKMLELYGKYEDTLNNIVKNREQYLTTKDPAYEPYVRIINAYDLYKQMDCQNLDISEALHATCLWYIFKYISGDDDDPMLFLDEQEDDGKGKQRAPRLNLNKISMYLIRKYCIVSFSGMLYAYIDNQYYKSTDRIKKDIVKMLMQIGYSDHTKIKETTNDIIFRIIYVCAKFKEFPFNKKSADYIPCSNGVVVLRNINGLLPQSPVFGFTYSLPTKFDPDVDTKPIKDFLTSLVDTDEEYELLLQCPAQGLMQDPDITISYALTGGGANGKSTYINLNTSLFGEQNVSAISLQDLSENRFAAAQLSGKLMNAFPDLQKTSIKTTGKFKAMTGGDGVMVEDKYGQPWKMKNKAVLIFAANSLPEIDDQSYAFFRRWCLIDFNKVFKMNPSFAKKIISPKNLSGYLNLVIDKLNRIRKNGFTISSKLDENRERWQKKSNSAYAFANERLEISPTDYIRSDTLYNLYLQYCDEQDFVALSKSKLNDEVEKIGGIIGRTTETQQQVRVVKGLKIKIRILPQIQIEQEEEVETSPTSGNDESFKIDDRPNDEIRLYHKIIKEKVRA